MSDLDALRRFKDFYINLRPYLEPNTDVALGLVLQLADERMEEKLDDAAM